MEKMKSWVALTIFVYMGIGCCYAQKKIDEAYLKCQYDYTLYTGYFVWKNSQGLVGASDR